MKKILNFEPKFCSNLWFKSIKIHIPLKWRLYCVIIFFVWFFYVFDAIPKWGALLLTYSFLWSRQFWKISGKILNISWWGFFMHNWTSHGVFSFTCFTFIHAKILLADSNIAPPIISQRKRLRCVVHFLGWFEPITTNKPWEIKISWTFLKNHDFWIQPEKMTFH